MKQATKLTDVERKELAILHAKGYSARAIARVFGRSPNTICSELARNSTPAGEYVPHIAAQKAYVRRKYAKYQGMQIEHNHVLRDYVVAGLADGWTPDQVSGAMRADKLPFYASKTAIYSWLYSGYGQPYCHYLPGTQCSKRTRKNKKATRTMVPNRVGITERPTVADNRLQAGHWEGDTVVSGKRTGGKAALAVVQERSTRYIRAQLIPDLRPRSFTAASVAMLDGCDVQTLTLDNGIENKQHAGITAATGAVVYFCDPYSSWQKGGVEHANKMLRRYFPKGCNLGLYDQAAVDAAVGRLNRKPRKILGYKSALQLAKEKGVI